MKPTGEQCTEIYYWDKRSPWRVQFLLRLEQWAGEGVLFCSPVPHLFPHFQILPVLQSKIMHAQILIVATVSTKCRSLIRDIVLWESQDPSADRNVWHMRVHSVRDAETCHQKAWSYFVIFFWWLFHNLLGLLGHWVLASRWLVAKLLPTQDLELVACPGPWKKGHHKDGPRAHYPTLQSFRWSQSIALCTKTRIYRIN